MNGSFRKLHWNNSRICCPSTSCSLNWSLICTFIGCGVVKNYGKYSAAHFPWAFFLALISALTFKLAGCRGTEAAVFAADIWWYLKICKLLSNHVIRWKHLLQTPCWESLTRFIPFRCHKTLPVLHTLEGNLKHGCISRTEQCCMHEHWTCTQHWM